MRWVKINGRNNCLDQIWRTRSRFLLTPIFQSIYSTEMKATYFLAFLLTIVPNIYADAIDDLAALLRGRSGNISEDRRSYQKVTILGKDVQTGCSGDTVSAGVQINSISGKGGETDTVELVVGFTGKYTRDGWTGPCVRSGSSEEKKHSGKATFRITAKKFQRPTVVFVRLTDFGESSDLEHDSNKVAIKAISNAVESAF
jgi:hypothetical protein